MKKIKIILYIHIYIEKRNIFFSNIKFNFKKAFFLTFKSYLKKMTLTIGINGFGRIGRLVFRSAFLSGKTVVTGKSHSVDFS